MSDSGHQPRQGNIKARHGRASTRCAAPSGEAIGRLNHFQSSTSATKLRGEYYTPPALVDRILEQIQPGLGDILADPSCGDGEFLVGAVRYLAASVPADQRYDAGLRLARRIVGFDIEEAAVATARERIREALRTGFGCRVDPESLSIHVANVLETPDRQSLIPLRATDRLVVVGNPPYVEAKRLPERARETLKARFRDSLSGAPDLYLYFLAITLDWLREGDRLALVLPNKVLVNANARALRNRMLEQGQLAGIDFATRAEIFPGAAVYPVVLYAAPPRTSHTPVRLSTIERHGPQLERTATVEVDAGAFRHTASRALFPLPGDPVLDAALLRMLQTLDQGRLDDVLEIRWSVSFHRQGLRERYVTRETPASVHARRFLGGGTFSGNGDVVRYRASWSGWWIDYDREKLAREGNAVPPAEIFERPKIAICQNGRTLRAAYDCEGFFLKDTLLCGLPRPADHPLARAPQALVALLCSRAAHFFYSHVFYGGHVNGGYLHFLRSFLVDIPIGRWTEEAAKGAAALVEQREAAAPNAESALEEQLEAIVSDALGLDRTEHDAIRSWAEEDENWTARERVRVPRNRE